MLKAPNQAFSFSPDQEKGEQSCPLDSRVTLPPAPGSAGRGQWEREDPGRREGLHT